MGTYLEEFLTSAQVIPPEVRRNYELMRNLDMSSQRISKELDELRKEYLTLLKDKKTKDSERAEEVLSRITEKHNLVMQKADEKVAIAVQTYDMVDKVIKELNLNVKKFEGSFQTSLTFPEVQTLRAEHEVTDTVAPKRKKQQRYSSAHASKQQSRASGSRVSRKKITGKNVEKSVEPVKEGVCKIAGEATAPAVKMELGAYCICIPYKQTGDMVGCDNEETCKRQWFHLECVGLTKAPAEGETWYCPDCTKEREEKSKKRKRGQKGAK